MDNLIAKLNKLKEMELDADVAGIQMRHYKELYKEKSKQAKETRDAFCSKLCEFCATYPISLEHFIREIEKCLFEENLYCQVNFSKSELKIDLKNLASFTCTQFAFNDKRNFVWRENDEEAKYNRKTYFLEQLIFTEINPKLLIKIQKNEKIIARFSMPFDIGQKFADGTNLIDNIGVQFEYLNNNHLKVDFTLNNVANLLIEIPNKYLVTHEQIGAGITPEIIQNILMEHAKSCLLAK